MIVKLVSSGFGNNILFLLEMLLLYSHKKYYSHEKKGKCHLPYEDAVYAREIEGISNEV